MQIVPAILTDQLADASRALGAFQLLSNLVHIDILDDTLVKGRTLAPNEFPPFEHGTIVWHLMVQDPLTYLDQCVTYPTKAVIVHVEIGGNVGAIAKAIHDRELLAGIALNPATPTAMVEPWLAAFDWVQVMTVTPGKQGSEFQPAALQKILAIQQNHPKVPIVIDGGVNGTTIHQVLPYRPAMITVGSFLQPGPSLGDHWREATDALKQGGA